MLAMWARRGSIRHQVGRLHEPRAGRGQLNDSERPVRACCMHEGDLVGAWATRRDGDQRRDAPLAASDDNVTGPHNLGYPRTRRVSLHRGWTKTATMQLSEYWPGGLSEGT